MTSPPDHDGRSGDVVELRVHGVAGAGPSRVLGRPLVHQVAGDRRAGFYRPEDPDATGPGGVVPEAYRWGDLPSGTAGRTLSLVFLLPFMLSNMAVWMRPPGRGSGVPVLCRLLALNLTLVYVLSAAGVALDLFAWRCLGSTGCAAGRGWLGGHPPGPRLAVLALIPVAAIGLVRALSAGTRHPYRSVGPADPAGDRLDSLTGWDRMPVVRRLRAVHVAAGLAVLDLTLLVARGATGVSVATAALSGVAAAVLAAGVALLCATGRLTRASRRTDRLARALCAVAGGLTVVTLAIVALDPAPWPRSAGLPGYDRLVAGLFLTEMALVVGLGTLVLWGHAGRARRPVLRRGLGAPVVGAVAAGLAAALSAEAVYLTAYVLMPGPLPVRPAELMAPAPAYQWAVLSFIVTTTAATVIGGVSTLVTMRRRRRAAAGLVARDFPAAPPRAAGRLRRVERIITRARFTEQLGPLAAAYACLAPVGLAAAVLGAAGVEPVPFAERHLGLPAGIVLAGLAAGSYATAAVVVALVVGGLFAYRTAGFRRYVGVLWDLGTFWPRAAHPFAPPSYAERAVPELADRIGHLTGRHAGVVLTGHSHGSVLLATTVLRLPPEVNRRVALLTHGSPLNRLYARLFPAYLGGDVLRAVGDRVGWRWVNLWRDTDFVGGWVLSGHRTGEPPTVPGPGGRVDRRLRDPEDLLPPAGHTVPPPVVGHWPGESDERFAAAVRELAARLRAADRS
ncbi:hypothetical protein [Micromonospora sp. NPDC126480]|uniref:hypothetical protein n=1 Tax=Micromonospora sp. NPDC126480 TaxID=3155312 RepID=UPI003332C524